MTYVNDVNPNNHLITGVIQGSVLPKSGTVSGTIITSDAEYTYGAAINLTSLVNLTVIEPVVKTGVTSAEYINTISYQVTKFIFNQLLLTIYLGDSELFSESSF